MSVYVIAALAGNVAPLVGAWIEINPSLSEYHSKLSLPSWERGLKYNPNLSAL